MVFVLGACGVTDFDITQPVVEQRVQGSPLPGPLAVLFPLPLDIDISSKIKAMETGPIDSVTLSKLTLDDHGDARCRAATPTTGRFVDSIHVFVKSNKSGTTLPRVEIANVDASRRGDDDEFHVDRDVESAIPTSTKAASSKARAAGACPKTTSPTTAKAVFTVHPL